MLNHIAAWSSSCISDPQKTRTKVIAQKPFCVQTDNDNDDDDSTITWMQNVLKST